MSVDLGWIREQENPFQPLVLEVPGREQRVWLQLEAVRQKKVLFNTKFVEPAPEAAAQPGGAECPKYSTILSVLLDVLTTADKDFFAGELELLGEALGPAGSPGRSLRLVRHAQQIASLFESYFRMGSPPEKAPAGNVNRGWQTQLWGLCEPLIRERTRRLFEQKSQERDPFRDALVLRMPEAEAKMSPDVQVEWTTSSNTRAELRWIAAQIVELLRNRQIADLNMVAVVLPPARAEEYAAQVAGIFSEEFNIPFALHESLNNRGTGYAPAFAQLLTVLLSGCKKENMLAVLELEAFAIARTSEEETLLERWVRQLGVVNGLTAEDLANTFVPEDERQSKFHWMQAVDKLCELALSVPSADVPVGVARGMFGLVQRLTKYFDTIADFRTKQLSTQKTLLEWMKALRILALNLFEENLEQAGPAERAEFSNLLRIIASLADEPGTSDRFDAEMIVELLRRPLMRGRPRRTGGLFQRGVAVFTLRPGSLRVPFTHVFLAGAEDGQLPRIDRVSGMHLFPQLALARGDTAKARDMRALRELLAQPKRKVVVSHVEKSIANGERKRPSHALGTLVGEGVVIRQAPLVKAMRAVNAGSVVQKAGAAQKKTEGLPGESEVKGKKTEPNRMEQKTQRRLSVKALEDVVLCPVMAHVQHNLAVAENPLPLEEERYPDIEIGFVSKKSIIKSAFEKWMTNAECEQTSLEELLHEVIEGQALSSATPARNLLQPDFDELLDTFKNLEKDSSDCRPSVRFAFANSREREGVVVLPEFKLNDIVLSGRLPGCVHFGDSTVTVTVLSGTTPPDDKSKFLLPIELAAKAMLTFCLLRCWIENQESQAREEWMTQFMQAENWRIRTLSSYKKGEGLKRERTIPAWDPEKANEWLKEIAGLLTSQKLHPLAPLKGVTANFRGKTKEKEEKKPRGKTSTAADGSEEQDYGRTIRKQFPFQYLGHHPYKNTLVLGNFILKADFEDQLDDVLQRRYPWIFE